MLEDQNRDGKANNEQRELARDTWPNAEFNTWPMATVRTGRERYQASRRRFLQMYIHNYIWNGDHLPWATIVISMIPRMWEKEKGGRNGLWPILCRYKFLVSFVRHVHLGQQKGSLKECSEKFAAPKVKVENNQQG